MYRSIVICFYLLVHMLSFISTFVPLVINRRLFLQTAVYDYEYPTTNSTHNHGYKHHGNTVPKKKENYSKIRKGDIYIQPNFLTPSQISALRNDITQLQQLQLQQYSSHSSTEISESESELELESELATSDLLLFKPSGLSNRVEGDGNIFGLSDRLTCTITPDLIKGDTKFSNMRYVFEEKMEQLKHELQLALLQSQSQSQSTNSKHTGSSSNNSKHDLGMEENYHICTFDSSQMETEIELELELAEMYYSISPKGSFLPRHQDERHEDTKGKTGWINDTRRSISWLVYLNDDGWGDSTHNLDTETDTDTFTDTDPGTNTDIDRNTNTNTNTNTNRDQNIGKLYNNSDDDDDKNVLLKEGVLTTAFAGNSEKNTNTNANTNAGHGGELRSYCRTCCLDDHIQCGSHEGDIQVGRIRCDLPSLASLSSSTTTTTTPTTLTTPTTTAATTTATANHIEFEPVFLDSWVKTQVIESTEKKEIEYQYDPSSPKKKWEPLSALYRIRRNKKRSFQKSESQSTLESYINKNKPLREYLSIPFGPNSPSWPSQCTLHNPTDFTKALAAQLTRTDHQSRFVGMEDIREDPVTTEHTTGYSDSDIDKNNNESSSSSLLLGMHIVDIVPTGGTLVLFDSVTVPHEVLEVTQGTRLAIAGWFHERQQDYPEWYGT